MELSEAETAIRDQFRRFMIAELEPRTAAFEAGTELPYYAKTSSKEGCPASKMLVRQMESLVVSATTALLLGNAGCTEKSSGLREASMDAGAPVARLESGAPAGGTLEQRKAAICEIMAETGHVDDAVVDSMLGDAASCILSASDYDNSCKTDSDCVAAGSGDACSAPCEPGCKNVTINVAELPRYQADLARTPFGYCSIGCGCPVGDGTPKCIAGTCGWSGLQIIHPPDAGKP